MGHEVVDRTVLRLLKAKGYSLQANRKTREGAQHPDRDAQFQHINQTVAAALAAGEPAISIDSKKRELVGDFKAVGREFEPSGRPVEVRTHDFKDKDLGHAIPFGIYDLRSDEGWVNVGIDGNTAEFAVNSIIGWWEQLGCERYPDAKRLTITADCGGANSNRTRLWKVECQRLADTTGLQIVVCHFPPGTSKWNKIEHRLFCFMSLNWRGRPLETHEVIINLIASTTTSTGLKVYAQLDRALLPHPHHSHRRTARRREHHPTRIPRRLELHHQPLTKKVVSPYGHGDPPVGGCLIGITARIGPVSTGSG